MMTSLDAFQPPPGVRPAWHEVNPVKHLERRLFNLDEGTLTEGLPSGMSVTRSAWAYVVYQDGRQVYQKQIVAYISTAAKAVAEWIAQHAGLKDKDTGDMALGKKAIELLKLLDAKGEVALDKAAWGGNLIDRLERFGYIFEGKNGKHQLTSPKGVEKLAEVAAAPRRKPRKSKIMFEHEPQPVEQPLAESDSQPASDAMSNLVEMLTDAVETATGESVESVEVHVTDSAAADERYAIPVLVQLAAAAQADEAQPVPSNSYIRIDMSVERKLDEKQLFQLYPDLGAMVAAIRAAGAYVEVCARVNTDVRGFQHE
jgi:hypothetical protein